MLVGAAHVAVERGEHPRAVALLRESLRLARDTGNNARIADALVGLARVAEATGQVPAAAALLGAAAALCETIGTPQVEHHEQHRRALAAARTGLGAAAFAAAFATGRRRSVEQAIAEAEAIVPLPDSPRGRIAAAPARSAAGDAGLTPREREVLRLLATGRSNQAIADELCVGHGTVKTHVANLLAKLGVETRAAAVARARRLGLIDP